MRIAPVVLIMLLLSTPGMSAADNTSAATLFAEQCARCHGSNGDGGGVMVGLMARLRGGKPPINFTDRTAMQDWPDGRLTVAITHGGTAVGGSTMMPSYGLSLTPDQISDLVVYIRSLAK